MLSIDLEFLIGFARFLSFSWVDPYLYSRKVSIGNSKHENEKKSVVNFIALKRGPYILAIAVQIS